MDYTVAVSAPTNEASGTWDFNWDYIYNYKNASSVAVGEYWILTAAHVADDGPSGDLTIGGTTYFQQEIIYQGTADLALVRFDKPLPGFYPLYTGEFPGLERIKGQWVDNRLDAVMVGFGVTGTVYSTYYTPVAFTDPSKGTKRWGTQKIDRTSTLSYTIDPLSLNSDGFEMDFDLDETSYEAGVGAYDSGGGTFVNDGGTWKLAGINTVYLSDANGAVSAFAVSVPAYTNWIQQTMDAVTGDEDSDGIPNWWEEQYGSTTGVDASGDQDGDGITGEYEYVADTDPTDSNAFWNVEGAFSLTNQTFVFDGSTARKYQVSHTTNDLTDPGLTWVTNNVSIWGEGPGTEITITNAMDPSIFCRIHVMLP